MKITSPLFHLNLPGANELMWYPPHDLLLCFHGIQVALKEAVIQG